MTFQEYLSLVQLLLKHELWDMLELMSETYPHHEEALQDLQNEADMEQHRLDREAGMF